MELKIKVGAAILSLYMLPGKNGYKSISIGSGDANFEQEIENIVNRFNRP